MTTLRDAPAAAPADGAGSTLADVLDNRRWWRRDRPFPHVVAHDVLRPVPHEAVEAAVRELTDPASTGYLEGHDLHGRTLTADYSGALSLFTSRAWHDLLAAVMEVPCTGHVNCGVHHHVVGSRSGFVHNDLNPGWFVGDPGPDEVVLADPRLCDYRTGTPGPAATGTPQQLVRAAAAIYYVGNGPWSRGDGGTTGLYRNLADPVGEPAAVVPPVDNSLLVFPCTPHSFHAFVGNRRRPRNSVIMWIHRSRADAVASWGEQQIVQYAR